MQGKFAATLALIAGIASGHWSDLAPEEHHYPERRHYEPERLPIGREGKHLAYLLGMDANGISDPQASNALDEMAMAMLERNVEYADRSEDIPTFHVVHSDHPEEEHHFQHLKQKRN